MIVQYLHIKLLQIHICVLCKCACVKQLISLSFNWSCLNAQLIGFGLKCADRFVRSRWSQISARSLVHESIQYLGNINVDLFFQTKLKSGGVKKLRTTKGKKQDENRHRGAIVLDGNVLQVLIILQAVFSLAKPLILHCLGQQRFVGLENIGFSTTS